MTKKIYIYNIEITLYILYLYNIVLHTYNIYVTLTPPFKLHEGTVKISYIFLRFLYSYLVENIQQIIIE